MNGDLGVIVYLTREMVFRAEADEIYDDCDTT